MYLNLLNIPSSFKSITAFRMLVIAIIYSITCISETRAQDVPDNFGSNFTFEVIGAGKKNMINEQVYVKVSDTAIYGIFDKLKPKAGDYFGSAMPKSPLMLGVKLNPALSKYFSAYVQSVSKHYQTFVIADSSDAILIAMGINRSNFKNYKYRVVENDSAELVPWSPIARLEQKYGAKQPYGFIGRFNAPGKRLMVEVADVNNYSIRDAVIFDWQVGFKPVIEQISVSTPKTYFNLAYHTLNKGYATRFDSKTGVPLDFKFPVDSVTNIGINLKKQVTLVQKVYLISNVNNKTDTSMLGFVDQYGYCRVSGNYFSQPGHYQIIIKKQEKYNVWDDALMLRIPFDVTEPDLLAKKISFKQLLPYMAGVTALLVAGIIVFRFYSKQKIKKAQRQQATVQLKLKTIRSQLNPHFMFNALSSIQNLMNKNELLEANHYMAKFAGLTRKALDTSEQEMISLEEELKIAEDYLQMEQLRFGFKFDISLDGKLNADNIEVPAMLLQPFIENAVKHGVALLEKDGSIGVTASQSEKNLVLTVADNGKGFNAPTEGQKGFGLKLSYERIDLINQLYGAGTAVLLVQSQNSGTQIQITLNNWI
ncbi:sensor histidine kinase [Mucilaginibacter calamicampi]|uniref:Sensor histidine kinase n=1 Tax=Mucilaginibacter calamicampi TaxID=1302352 RepID=A0ABW2YXI7_9SPHI